MPKYLLQVNYTLDGVKGVLAKGGSARKSAAQAAAKSVGGKLDSFYFAFGGTDVFTVADLPDNAAAAALALERLGWRRGNRQDHGPADAGRDRRCRGPDREVHAARGLKPLRFP